MTRLRALPLFLASLASSALIGGLLTWGNRYPMTVFKAASLVCWLFEGVLVLLVSLPRPLRVWRRRLWALPLGGVLLSQLGARHGSWSMVGQGWEAWHEVVMSSAVWALMGGAAGLSLAVFWWGMDRLVRRTERSS